MKPYRYHIFVCQGKRCLAKGGEEVIEVVKERIKKEGLKEKVIVSRSGCLKVCKETDQEGMFCPVVVVYPEGVWYREVKVADVEKIVERHIKAGEVVECLLHYRL